MNDYNQQDKASHKIKYKTFDPTVAYAEDELLSIWKKYHSDFREGSQ